jgi:hypothetical protein
MPHNADEAAPFPLGQLVALVQDGRLAPNLDAEIGRSRQVGQRLLKLNQHRGLPE